TYTLSPTKLNTFSFHYQDFKNAILGVTTNPNIVFPSVQTGANVNVPQQTIERKYQIRDDFSWIKGKHAMQFGANYIRTELAGFFFFGPTGIRFSSSTIRWRLRTTSTPAIAQRFRQIRVVIRRASPRRALLER